MENTEKTANTVVIKADIFIVPNEAMDFQDFGHNKEWLAEKLKKHLGIMPSEDEKLVQVWITSEKSDNWDHPGSLQEELGIEYNLLDDSRENRLMGYFPSRLPESILSGKREGDIIRLRHKTYDVDIELTCKQQEYRYRNFGAFEEVLKYVLEVAFE